MIPKYFLLVIISLLFSGSYYFKCFHVMPNHSCVWTLASDISAKVQSPCSPVLAAGQDNLAPFSLRDTSHPINIKRVACWMHKGGWEMCLLAIAGCGSIFRELVVAEVPIIHSWDWVGVALHIYTYLGRWTWCLDWREGFTRICCWVLMLLKVVLV